MACKARALLKYKPGTMRRWIKEDSKGVEILGIRRLLKGDRWGEFAFSLATCMRDLMDVGRLRIGRSCSTLQGMIGIVDTGEWNLS